MNTFSYVFLMMGLLIPAVRGQDPQYLDKLLANLRENRPDYSMINNLQKYSDDPRVIPALRAAFDAHEQKETRQSISISLIGLRDKDDRYFRYLEAFAKEAVDSDVPDMFVYGPDGVALNHPIQFSPEFYAWSAQHGMSVESAFKMAYKTFPMDVMLFGLAKDPRTTELLRRGLQSHDPMVAIASVDLLAVANDTASLARILQLINTSPKGTSEFMIYSLTRFDGDLIERRILESLRNPALKARYQQGLEEKHKPSTPQ